MKLKVAFETAHVVTYYGLQLQIPVRAKYIATDSNGYTWAYAGKPELSDVQWCNTEGAATLIAHVHLDGMDWKETLVAL